MHLNPNPNPNPNLTLTLTLTLFRCSSARRSPQSERDRLEPLRLLWPYEAWPYLLLTATYYWLLTRWKESPKDALDTLVLGAAQRSSWIAQLDTYTQV